MKNYVLLLALCFSQISQAQIYGNGNATEFSRTVDGLTTIDIQFNADITLDYSAEEVLSIEIDENIKDLVGIDFVNGKLTLDQVKWIEPKSLPKIRIGTPNLLRVFQGTHSSTEIVHVNSSNLRLEGNVGKIKASGKVELLKINVSGTDLDLENLEIGTAKIDILEGSKLQFGKVDKIETPYEDDERIKLKQEPKEYIVRNPKVRKNKRPIFEPNPDLRYIPFKVRNNSFTRKHFVVVGPKKNGNTFSYGFSMFPKTNKSEKWSVGTLIYQEKRNGERKLLVTIKEEDEGKVISLFE